MAFSSDIVAEKSRLYHRMVDGLSNSVFEAAMWLTNALASRSIDLKPFVRDSIGTVCTNRVMLIFFLRVIDFFVIKV